MKINDSLRVHQPPGEHILTECGKEGRHLPDAVKDTPGAWPEGRDKHAKPAIRGWKLQGRFGSKGRTLYKGEVRMLVCILPTNQNCPGGAWRNTSAWRPVRSVLTRGLPRRPTCGTLQHLPSESAMEPSLRPTEPKEG